MYAADWLGLLIWISLSGLGNIRSALIMIPITLVFGILNHLYARTAMSVFKVDINLMAVTVTGILLNTMLFVTFIYGDSTAVSIMIPEIVAGVLGVFTIAVISMMIKDHQRKTNARILRELQSEEDSDEDDESTGDEEYMDDEPDEDMDRLDISAFRQKGEEPEEDEEPEDDGPEDENETADAENEKKEPKFRVIVKNRGKKQN